MNVQELKPSDFANLGQPMCSRWGKSEIEWLALAYVQALAADGDTWKKLTKQQVRKLLTDKQRGLVRFILEDDYYQHWFDAVSEQITDAEGAMGVGGFWNEYRFTQGKEGGQ
jgi:hypothetical protein